MAGESAYVGVFNIGSSDEISINGLAERVIAAAASESEIKLVPYEEAYEAGFEDMAGRIPDTRKIRELLGWAPTRDLDQILRGVIESHRRQDEVDRPTLGVLD